MRLAVKRGVMFALGALLAVPAFAQASESGPAKTTRQAKKKSEAVKRGEYLVSMAGCQDCHTPFKMTDKGPIRDPERRFSGHPENLQMLPAPELPPGPWGMVGSATMTAWSGPWGVSYTANLTPDEETGIGKWTEQMFIQAMRTGRHMGQGRPILPPMPWENLNHLTDEDLKAVFAFLKSTKPIKNKVPAPVPPSTQPPTAPPTSHAQ